ARDLVMAANTRSELIGKSLAMAAVRTEIVRLAPTDTPVLVIGESGVGKELVAHELHRLSERTGPLVCMNAAALPESLAESELFGHAAGAYTGASGRGRGLFEEAEHGTLFLDEIGEMPTALQPKLLRALATGEIRSVGEAKTRNLDVRVVAATNVDLEAAVDEGAFRGDLYARLAGDVIVVPPLRDRREDIVELASAFLARERGPSRIDVDAAEALMVHPWRFNVRELEQAIRSAASRAGEGAQRLELDHLPKKLRAPLLARAARGPEVPVEADLPLHLRVRPDGVPSAAELELVLREHGGNVKAVAAFFGRHRAQIYRWAERLKVDLDAFRE
ncbi:MAG: sigma 54-interacting transcriptional regulator, partial [Myxococcales bacterium]|nr:sigma 54-interacting transcriptional regulator [Myxococcales bacterium]